MTSGRNTPELLIPAEMNADSFWTTGRTNPDPCGRQRGPAPQFVVAGLFLYISAIHPRGAVRPSGSFALQTPAGAVLGLAYKPDVDEARASPSFELIEKLEQQGVPYVVRPRHQRAVSRVTVILDGGTALFCTAPRSSVRPHKDSCSICGISGWSSSVEGVVARCPLQPTGRPQIADFYRILLCRSPPAAIVTRQRVAADTG
jgi:hypothetical protein